MSIGRFYGGVAALLTYPPTRQYLLLQRAPEKDFGAGAWECVTGRVDQGEGFEDALRREVAEEVSVRDFQIDFIVGTTHFYRGQERPEDELIGVVYCCSITDPGAIRLSPEHTAHHWLTAVEAYEFLTAANPGTTWMKRVIQRAEAIRLLTPAALLDFCRQHGFELG
jgi:8-oxo-dGTP pyrophosphatase MutT (NUDIX family)